MTKNKTQSKQNGESQQDVLEDYSFFPTTIYKISKPEFHKELLDISDNSLKETKKLLKQQGIEHLDPLCDMSENMIFEPRIQMFADYVIASARNILESQGYDLTNQEVILTSIWAQEHYRYSDMAQHIHANEGLGVTQMVGFYFLDVNEFGSQMVLHDPRPSKVITDLPLRNPKDISLGSSMIYIRPDIGDLFLTNSYTPHSFTKNFSDKSVKFLHINIVVRPNFQQNCEVPVNTLNNIPDYSNVPEII